MPHPPSRPLRDKYLTKVVECTSTCIAPAAVPKRPSLASEVSLLCLRSLLTHSFKRPSHPALQSPHQLSFPYSHTHSPPSPDKLHVISEPFLERTLLRGVSGVLTYAGQRNPPTDLVGENGSRLPHPRRQATAVCPIGPSSAARSKYEQCYGQNTMMILLRL